MGLGDLTNRFLKGIFGSPDERVLSDLQPKLYEVNALEPQMRRRTDAELRNTTAELRARLDAGETLDDVLPVAFASVREAGRRIQGMRHYDVQLIGAMILHSGKIAEMVTGEGKTLVATPAAYLNALPGKGVHVVTVNDYLAKRDRDWMAPVYEALGMTVGCIQNDMDNPDRQVQYGCDITYGTNNEFGFDYLRDNMKVRLQDQVQRDYHYAIVDEVDSILVDEARTPLIIAGPSEEATGKYYEANKVVQGLIRAPDNLPHDADHDAADYHFIIKEKEHQAVLTEKGLAECERRLGVADVYATADVDWPHHLTQALRANHLYKRDQEYVVTDGEIVIVDEFTGRMMPGRRWSDGLHQAVEAKEGQKIQAENQTLATITLQNYFKLYQKLAGMTGTAKTEEGEFDKIYKLGVVVIPTNRPLIRIAMPDVIYMTEGEKYNAIAEELARVHATGRPVLVGTVSIEKSEVLSALLQRRGVPHEVLNAKHHAREASIVSKAGQLGQITIATNMAGRGTDIVLGTFTHEALIDHWKEFGLAPRKLRADLPRAELEEQLVRHWAGLFLPKEDKKGRPISYDEKTPEQLRDLLVKTWAETGHPILKLGTHVQDLGGLHILGTGRHDSRRIDNQLRGRAGRQGDPGSSQFFLALDDDLMRRFAGPKVQWLLQKLGMKEGDDITSPMVSKQVEKAQSKVELHNFEIRKNLLEYDEVMNEQRKTIYGMRQNILEEADQHERVLEMIDYVVDAACERYMNPAVDPSERDPEALSLWIKEASGLDVTPKELADRATGGIDALPQFLRERFRGSYAAKDERLTAAARERLPGRIAEQTAAITADIESFLSAAPADINANAAVFAAWFTARCGAPLEPAELHLDEVEPGEADPAKRKQLRDLLADRAARAIEQSETEAANGVLRKFENYELLETIDTKWKDHLLTMDHLRDAIGLRGYAQVDPKVEYKREGYQLFLELQDSIRQEVVGHVLRREPPVHDQYMPVQRLVGTEVDFDEPGGGAPAAEPPPPEVIEAQQEAAAMMQAPPQTQPGGAAKVGRNEPCPCGSGRKYKKCHGAGGGEAAPVPVPGGGAGPGGVPKVGKNKPCPCGSGKKYKQCHGKG